MTNNLFIGGFPYETTQDELVSLFSKCGTVKSAKILIDRETGRSRGLAFIEMSTELEAADAIAKLDGCLVGSRKIFVSEARPQDKKPGGFDAKPGFNERRSGRDRRAGAGPSEPRREEWKKRPSFGDDRKPFGDRKKTWDAKPGFGADRKPFSERKKSWGDKPGGGKGKPFGGEKKWGGKRPGGGGKNFGGKRRFGS